MRLSLPTWLAAGLGLAAALAAAARADQPAITIYNQDFGVVRERVHLDLKPGVNAVTFTETTAHLEPDSVILRDPTGQRKLTILEQNYRNDPLSQELLLSLFEGQTINFEISLGEGRREIKPGRIVRSGYVPHREAYDRYGNYYAARQSAMAYGGGGVPIIEMDGVLRFGLPGIPLFPSLKDDTILKPTLTWQIGADVGGPLDAELAYVTGGMTWKADYNVVSPAEGDQIELHGWITMDNQSGRTFPEARIKLMAGDVAKLQPGIAGGGPLARPMSEMAWDAGQPVVREKSFDEYHLYTLERPTTLRDRETKQVEFVSAQQVQSQRIYVYEGADLRDPRWSGMDLLALRDQPDYGVRSNPKIWVMREFRNSRENNLEIPLPAGRLRFYRKDEDGRLEFVGEGQIDHTPVNEEIRVYTGNAFDLVGQRTRTHFAVDHGSNWLDEAFEITLRNHKKEAVEVRVVERLYRWANWEVVQRSQDFRKIDSQVIEFRVNVPAEGEARVTYKVHYTW